MKIYLRNIYKLLPEKLERRFYELYFQNEHKEHAKLNTEAVSNLTKQNQLLSIAKQNNIKQLVETGTYLGDTIYMLSNYFEKIYSIELSEYYYEKAKLRFSKTKKIHLLQGDSGEVLQNLIKEINQPTLFWLDGHYSGGKTALGKKQCPIYEELNHIFTSKHKHLIVIDDARLFIGKDDYPTIIELKKFLAEKKENFSFNIVNDAIIIKEETT